MLSIFDFFRIRKSAIVLPAPSATPIGIQQRYWNHLVQQKFDELYVSRYLQRSEWWDTSVNAFLAITSATSVSAWALWKKYDLLWAGIVMLAQIVTVAKQFLPFRKRIAPLRAAGYAYEEIFLKAEAQWFEVSSGELSESEINDRLFEFKTDQAKAWKKIAGDISLPSSRRLRVACDRLTAEYFQHNYHVAVTIYP